MARAHKAAAGRIQIMAGSGLNADTVSALLAEVPLQELHGSCALPLTSDNPVGVWLGLAPKTRKHTSAAEVRRMKIAIQQAA